MPRKRAFISLAVASILVFALSGGAQGASGATYQLQGLYEQSPECDSPPCGPGFVATYFYEGTGTCVRNCQNVSPTGMFDMFLAGEGSFPPSPCVSKRVSGTLQFAPVDPISPAIVAQVSGHNVDYKGYRVRGQITAGPLTGRSVSAFVTYPGGVSPLAGCDPGTFTGTLEYHPVDPV